MLISWGQNVLKLVGLFLYNSNKIPLIPPLLINNEINQMLRKKQTISRTILHLSLYTPITNSSVLPTIIFHKTEARLTSIIFEVRCILKIVRYLNVNKAHDHFDISIRIVKEIVTLL